MGSMRAILLLAAAAAAFGQSRRAVVVGIDGLGSKGLASARTPNIDALRRQGAWTLHARGVMPTSSSPNWASMIMGAGPEQHGVTSNDWQPDRFEIAPACVGRGGIFPTVYGMLRDQRPKAVIATFAEWEDYDRLVERDVADVMGHPDGPRKNNTEPFKGGRQTIAMAVDFLRARRPDLLFIHLDLVDHAGHHFGHLTPEYVAAVEEADRLVGVVAAAVREAGEARPVLLLTADHGGVGKKHGGATMAEIEIPWIIEGPGIARGHEIAAPVNTYDTAPTLSRVLGIKPHPCWIGKAVEEAIFETTSPR
jgi:predicted AlkP superfamily pyrophosphatase or phosphodiesterase